MSAAPLWLAGAGEAGGGGGGGDAVVVTCSVTVFTSPSVVFTIVCTLAGDVWWSPRVSANAAIPPASAPRSSSATRSGQRRAGRAIDLVLRDGRPGETYNVGSRLEASIEELADRILAALGKPSSLKTIVPDRPGHDRRYLLDASKIERELGWRPAVDFDTGLEETVRWYAENRDWWEPLKRRAPVEETAWR